jgi:iron complex outermembrane receptor protein
VVSPVYGAGVCDIPILGALQVFLPQSVEEEPWLWDAAISYDITSDLMVYGHAGTSWRQPFAGVGISNGTGNPQLNQFILGDAEESKSYEVGFKWSFLEGRGYLFTDYYYQKFDGLIFSVPGGARYLAGPTTVRSNPFFVNTPAKIKGADLELGLRVTDRWSVTGNFSWAEGETSGSIPCTDGNFDGIPDGINAPAQAFIDRGIAVATVRRVRGRRLPRTGTFG